MQCEKFEESEHYLVTMNDDRFNLREFIEKEIHNQKVEG